MAEEQTAPEESGTAEVQEQTSDELWASTESPFDAESAFTQAGGTAEEPPKEEPPSQVEETQSEPGLVHNVQEPVQETVQAEETTAEPVHDYEKRYKDLEREFHRRNQERKQEQEEHDRLRLARLEETQQRENERKELEQLRQFREANTKPKEPTPADENYLSEDDRQTMEDFSEITGVVSKMIDQKIAKQPASGLGSDERERLEKLEKYYQQEQVRQFLSYHDSVMKQEVGENYLEIDTSPEFKSYVESSPTKLKIMQESTNPKDHAEVMNMFLSTSSNASKFRNTEMSKEGTPISGSSQAETKRQAASGMMGNQAPVRDTNPKNLTEDELWDSISV